MQPAPIPNLSADERGFQLDTGELVAVRATPAPAPDGVFAVEVVARQCEPDGTTSVVNGHPIMTPPQRHSIAQDAIASGTASVPLWLADLTVAAAGRVVPMRSALAAWTTLFPVAPPL